jgi:hypothetical protein
MREPGRPVLLVCGNTEIAGRFRGLLPPPTYLITEVPDIDRGLSLAMEKPFELLVIQFAASRAAIAEFLKSIRWSGSPNRQSAVVLLAAPSELEEAEQLLERGVGRILNPWAADPRLEHALREILVPDRRVPVRALIRLVGEDLGLHGTVMAQTKDLSATGMLVRLDKPVPIGVRFGFTLEVSGMGAPVRGTAAVVRATGSGADRVEGFAARFVELDGDAADRVARYLDREARRPKKPGKI